MFRLIISFFILFSSFSFAINEKEIKTVMSNKIDKVLMILKDSKLNNQRKGEEIISIMDPVFNYELMSRLSLGKTWKNISDTQKNQFTKLFTQKLKDSYIEKLDLYTDQLVEILGLEKPKQNRILLQTQLIGKEEKYNINYKFYKEKNQDKWFIYDVDLLGVSIIQTYRKQFSGFLKNKSFDELLAYLKTNKEVKPKQQ